MKPASTTPRSTIGEEKKYKGEFSPLHVNWVPVDDKKRNSRAQMRWVVDR